MTYLLNMIHTYPIKDLKLNILVYKEKYTSKTSISIIQSHSWSYNELNLKYIPSHLKYFILINIDLFYLCYKMILRQFCCNTKDNLVIQLKRLTYYMYSQDWLEKMTTELLKFQNSSSFLLSSKFIYNTRAETLRTIVFHD